MTMIIHTDNLPDIDVDTSSFVYDGDFIFIQDEYITNVLKCMNVPEINDDEFYTICGEHFKDYPEVLENYALKSTQYSYYYARAALKGRFELGEQIIATDALYSYRYALYVLKGRFELGENVIATDAYCSYMYAHDAFKGRFELGETTIATNAYYSYCYSHYVLKGRFELGEPIIATDGGCSYWYALFVLKGRFDLGEYAILNSDYADQYREQFLCQ